MNKSEKLICLVLGGLLAWYIWSGASKQPAANPGDPAAETNAVPAAVTNAVPAAVTNEVPAAVEPVEPVKPAYVPAVPERFVCLENDEVKVELSTWGAVVTRVTLKRYARDCGAVSESNPAVVFDYSDAPLGRLSGLRGVEPNEAYDVREASATGVTFTVAGVTRRVSLRDNYQVVYEERFASPTAAGDKSELRLSLGAMRLGPSKNDLLSVDSCTAGDGEVVHHGDDDDEFKQYLVGSAGGCSGGASAENFPVTKTLTRDGARTWLAIKNRFFVTALCSSTQPNTGFEARVTRDTKSAQVRPECVALEVRSEGVPAERTTVFYAGPKKQAYLSDHGMRDVMEFGMWRWLCYPIVWVLNFFYDLIPNYGVAIILLTILVRILFWPLTRKSTIGMRKMQELQPKMKELREKFKDNPQRMQQEVWLLYKTEKVNPLSSCLPMLIQIPVFIALFNVLRSSVELRYAPFLWISDLSEPEALFADWFPFGGLNLLPILMAVTTALQSAFTPSSTGDKSQQKMMMIFMPAMMLIMFYSFPSALSLYWFLSNLMSIAQMWLIRRQTAKKTAALEPEVIDPPQTTRQMRRHG